MTCIACSKVFFRKHHFYEILNGEEKDQLNRAENAGINLKIYIFLVAGLLRTFTMSMCIMTVQEETQYVLGWSPSLQMLRIKGEA